MSLATSMARARALADAKGFSSAPERTWEMLALIHTEVSEATDAYKKGESLDHVGEELIDAVIRIFHLISALERRMTQKTTSEPLFTIEWKVV